MGEINILFRRWTAAEFRCLYSLEGTLWFGDELNSFGYLCRDTYRDTYRDKSVTQRDTRDSYKRDVT